jgi:chemotaxis protein methyltransferase CheR
MPALDELAALVERESGIVLRASQLDALAAALRRVDPAVDAEAFLRRAADPVEGRIQLARLLDELTVKETFFLREPAQLEAIPWQLLFDRAQATGAGGVRIWSAGCATGEEAYTLALLACEASGAAVPPVRILATDVSERALAAAREGEYRARSTRDLDSALRDRYFHAAGERLFVGDRLRSLVSFARHNLVTDPLPPPGEARFDLILCRNVLIYFDTATADRVTVALSDALAPSGMLILGSADALYRGAGRLRALAAAVSSPATTAARRSHGPPRPLGRERRGSPSRGPAPLARTGASRASEPVSDPLPDAELLDGAPHFLAGLAALEVGDAQAAVEALRRALYADPRLGVAAFQLGRAYEALGEPAAARRAYEQALRTCEPEGDLHDPLLDQVELGDVVTAVKTRLEALSRPGG